MRLPGVGPIMSCRRVKESASPTFSAANVTTIRSRAGMWISGSSASTVMCAPSCATQPNHLGGVALRHKVTYSELLCAALRGTLPAHSLQRFRVRPGANIRLCRVSADLPNFAAFGRCAVGLAPALDSGGVGAGWDCDQSKQCRKVPSWMCSSSRASQ